MQLIRDDIYYPICLDFKFHRLYIIWIANEEDDELLVNDDNRIIAFRSEDELNTYSQNQDIELCEDVAKYAFYKLQQWLIDPYPKFEYDDFLNLWNLFTDVSTSVKLEFIGDIKDEVRNSIYDKLFDASNVFIADEPNPTFEEIEIKMLKKVMQQGLDLLLNNLVIIGDE